MDAKNFWPRAALVLVILLLPLGLHLKISTDPNNLNALFSCVVVVLIAGASAVILMKMMFNDIDLKFLISDEKHDASMSRFKFLFFTFVLGAGYFAVLLANLKATGEIKMTEIPNGVLGLIGISGGSYVVAKGIQNDASQPTSGQGQQGQQGQGQQGQNG